MNFDLDEKRLKKIVRETLLEAIPEDEDDPFDKDIDPDNTLSSDDIRPGSDLSPGDKIGGTIMPHGHGYPNWNWRRHMSREELDKILHLGFIYGFSEEEQDAASLKDKQATIDYIRQHCPYVPYFRLKDPQYQTTIGHEEYYYPFAQYFNNELGWGNWAREFAQTVQQYLGYFKHHLTVDPQKVGQMPPGPFQYDTQRQWAEYEARREREHYENLQQPLTEHPTLISDFEKLLEFLSSLQEKFLTNPTNPASYPVYVSLYDVTRRLGGAEEGGWWYDASEHIKSIRVNSYREARNGAVQLLRAMYEADMNGKPEIILEKEEGSQDSSHQPPPHYS